MGLENERSSRRRRQLAKTTPPTVADGKVHMTSFPNEELLALDTTEAFTLSLPALIGKRVIGGEALIAGLCVRQ
jgi:hypothetical protein